MADRDDCKAIEKRMKTGLFKTATFSCTRQMEPRDFLIQVDLQGHSGMFQLTAAEYEKSDWPFVLGGHLGAWLDTWGEM
jgi:hypothetical protein